jgi:hypothetical protein
MPKLHYRMTATKDYRNGSIAWPAGMSAYWPKGETRDLLPPVFEQLQRDAGPFEYHQVVLYAEGEQPAPVTIDRSDGVQAEEASAAGEALAQYAQEQAAAPADKRVAALEKARAAKAAKKAAKE